MRANTYMQERRGRWFVRVRVPADLVRKVGKTHVVRSLGTSDLAVAKQRRRAALAAILEWQASQTVSDGWTPPLAYTTVSDGAANARQPSSEPAMRQPLRLARNQRSQNRHRDEYLQNLLERWLAENVAGNTNQTLSQHRIAVTAFLARYSPRLAPADVTRKIAGDHVSGLVRVEKSQKTVNRKLSSLSSFWRWLVRRGLADQNPWAGQSTLSARVKKGVSKKRAYNKGELCALLASSPESIIGQRYGFVIRDLIRLGLLTGCRIGELCDIRVEDVLLDTKVVCIRRGKTENARRSMPIHRLGWPIIARRVKASKEGWLFPDLTPGGPDGKRSWNVVKRFASFRQTLLGLDRTVDFHSLRRTFATYLERASVGSVDTNHSTIAELMGHAKPTLALSLYSAGLAPAQLRQSIDALDRVIEPEVLKLI